MKKKVLAAVLVVCVVFGAGAALAQQVKPNDQAKGNLPARVHQTRGTDRNFEANRGPNRMPQHNGPRFCEGMGMPGGRALRFTPDMPKEIRAKVVELAKLKIDLEAAMYDKPLNKAKVMELYANVQKVKAEIEAWRFETMLERGEEFKIQMELNKQYSPEPQGNVEEVKEEPENAN